MSQQESKQADPQVAQAALHEAIAESKGNATVEDASSGDDAPADSSADAAAAGAAAKKKRAKRKKIKAAIAEKDEGQEGSSGQLSGEQLQMLLKDNPALKAEVQGMDPNKAAEMMKKLSVSDILTGMVWRVRVGLGRGVNR